MNPPPGGGRDIFWRIEQGPKIAGETSFAKRAVSRHCSGFPFLSLHHEFFG